MLEKLMKLKNLEEGLILLNIKFIKVEDIEVDQIYVEDEDDHYYYLKKELKNKYVNLYKNYRRVKDFAYLSKSKEDLYPENIRLINDTFYITCYNNNDDEDDEDEE